MQMNMQMIMQMIAGENVCELNCRALTFRFYALLNETVIDGTLCHPDDPSRVCVAGSCKVGSKFAYYVNRIQLTRPTWPTSQSPKEILV